MIYKNDEAFNFEKIEDRKMTKEEIKQLWLKSDKTLIIEIYDKVRDRWMDLILTDPSFTAPDGEYRFKEGQDFSIINDKVKKAWNDSGKTLIIEVTHPHRSWIEAKRCLFYTDLIYRIKTGQEIPKVKYTSADAITEACEQIKNMLLEKNRKYGDSALRPVRVFSKADSAEQLKVRMDDKLSRIQSAQDDDLEDAMLDLTGYLVLDIARKLMEEKGA